MSLLQVEHVKKIYQTRKFGRKVEALSDVHFSVEKGEYVAIMGESGSGKTTLLNILATLDMPTAGQVLVSGKNTREIKGKEISTFRRDYLGFVFQEFHLLDTLNVHDNMVLPLVLGRKSPREIEEAYGRVERMMGLSGMGEKFPYEMSGGQQQRVAIGRAIINRPSLLLADEPTGALDSKSTGMILDVFDKINESGQTVVMVTHSQVAASRAKRVLFIKDGQLYNQIFRGNRTSVEMFQMISDTLTVMAGGREGTCRN